MVKKIEEIKHPAVRAVIKYLIIGSGLEIHHDGDLPARTGLGSSSAFTVGILHSLYALKGMMPTKHRLAEEAIHIERNVLREHVGSQDQAAVSYGGFNKITFGADGSFRVEPIIYNRERLDNFQNHIMLYFTGFSRIASHIAKKQITNTPNKTRELMTMQHMVDDAIAILTSGSDMADFGKLLHESWLLKRSLTKEISNSDIDSMYTCARQAGALGGKILGAGGGGFMILFVPLDKQENVRKKLKGFLEVKFRFENTGSQIIFYHDAGIQEGKSST
jgi:D-glycero-alpha-D-manno-heptose-7-phosphate kinase